MASDSSLSAVEPVLDEAMNVLRRRKLVVVLTAICAVLAIYAALQFMPERYEAEARLMMVLGRENIQVPVTVQNGGVYASGVQREEINSEIQLLRSHEVVSRAIESIGVDRFAFRPLPPRTQWERIKYEIGQTKRWLQEWVTQRLIDLGLKKSLTPTQKAVELVNESLDAAREPDSNVIHVSLRLPDREVAIATLAGLVQFYLERHVAVRGGATVLPLLAAQVEKDRVELAGLKDDRLTLLRTWRLASTTSKSAQLQERLQKVLYEADAKRSQLEQSLRQLDALSNRTTSLPVREQERQIEVPNPAVQPLQNKLNELRVRRAELASRYKDPTVPFVRQIDEQIDGVEALRAAQAETEKTTTYISNPVRQTLESQREADKVAVVGLRAGIKEDERHAQELTEELSHLSDGESQLQLVDLRIEAAQKRFLSDSARRDEAQINEALDRRQITNVVLLSAPSSKPEPVAPNKLRIMEIGMVVGLLLGFGLGVFIEWSDDTIYGARELVRATRLPYLGEFRIGRIADA